MNGILHGGWQMGAIDESSPLAQLCIKYPLRDTHGSTFSHVERLQVELQSSWVSIRQRTSQLFLMSNGFLRCPYGLYEGLLVGTEIVRTLILFSLLHSL